MAAAAVVPAVANTVNAALPAVMLAIMTCMYCGVDDNAVDETTGQARLAVRRTAHGCTLVGHMMYCSHGPWLDCCAFSRGAAQCMA